MDEIKNATENQTEEQETSQASEKPEREVFYASDFPFNYDLYYTHKE